MTLLIVALVLVLLGVAVLVVRARSGARHGSAGTATQDGAGVPTRVLRPDGPGPVQGPPTPPGAPVGAGSTPPHGFAAQVPFEQALTPPDGFPAPAALPGSDEDTPPHGTPAATPTGQR